MRTYNKLASRIGLGLVSFLTLAGLLLLSGCSIKATPPASTSAGGIIVNDGMGNMTLYSVTMPDGTPCVAAVGYYKGGVDCDFTQKRLTDAEFHALTMKGEF